MLLKHADNTYSSVNESSQYPLDILIPPSKQSVIYTKSQISSENEVRGIIQPSLDLEHNDDLIICPSLTILQNKQFTALINNFLAHPYVLKKGRHISTFSTLTPEQANYIKPNNPALFRHLVDTNDNDAIQHVNAFSKMPQSEEFNKTH